MTTPPTEVVAAFWEALYDRDWSRIRSFFGPESIYYDMPTGPTTAAKGPDGIEARLRIGLDGDFAERILQPILENACRYSASNIRISIARQDSNIVYAIEDDGGGVTADESERIFEPGVRGGAQPEVEGARAGLGLALSRRLARSVDGDVVAEAAAEGGRFLVRLPAG